MHDDENHERDPKHLQDLVQTYRRRLKKLELQAAAFGLNTPPYIQTEIEDTQAKIDAIEDQLRMQQSEAPIISSESPHLEQPKPDPPRTTPIEDDNSRTHGPTMPRGASSIMTTRKVIGALAVVAFLAFIGWLLFRNPPIQYRGRVSDSQTQAALPSAKITLEVPGRTPIIVYTDSEGVYRFSINLTTESVEAHIRVDAEEYAPYDRRITLTREADQLEDIRLTARSAPATSAPPSTTATLESATAAPAATTTSTAATASASVVTSTSAITLPVTVAITTSGCDESDIGKLKEDAASGVSQVVADGLAQMQISVNCAPETTIVTHFPPLPATPVELLAEADTLTVTSELIYGRTFIRAAVAYAGGQYERASNLLEVDKNFIRSGDARLLLGLAYMHQAQWSQARTAFAEARDLMPSTDVHGRANAYGGESLAYIVELQQGFDEELNKRCRQEALSGYVKASELEPERGLWWTGQAVAPQWCPPEDDQYIPPIIHDNAEQGIALSPESRPLERAYALIVFSHVLAYVHKPDTTKATHLADEARRLAPMLPTPYGLLSCLALRQDDPVTAQDYYRQFRERAGLPGEQQDLPAQMPSDFCDRY